MVKKQVTNKREFYKIPFWILAIVSFIMLSLLIIATNKQGTTLHNEATMYCEMANINAEMANMMVPYFEMYMDENIDTISEINDSLGRVFELSMVGRNIEVSIIDCPQPKCDALFGLDYYNEIICDFIKELKLKEIS